MKITKRDIGLLVMLVGVLAAIISYNFLYQKNVEKAEAEKVVLQGLKDTQAGLKELEDNLPFYKAEIERMTAEDREITAHYPANVLPETEIMYAVQMEENNETYFNALSYGAPVEITTGFEDQTGLSGYDLAMTMSYQSTYQGLKDVINYTLDQNDRKVITAVTAAYDSTTGHLNGTMTLDQYYMTGTDSVYVDPYVPAIKIGLDNIFGSSDIALDAETEVFEEEAVPEESFEAVEGSGNE